MQPVNTSTTTGGSNETRGIIGSSHGTLERENSSHVLYPEGDSLDVLQPNLEEDVSADSLLANKKLRAACWKDFELTMLADGTYKALCKHCKKDFVAGNRAGTSHLNYHIKVCPKNQS